MPSGLASCLIRPPESITLGHKTHVVALAEMALIQLHHSAPPPLLYSPGSSSWETFYNK